MFSPLYQATLTPIQFATFMCNKPANEQVIMLARNDGNVLVIADKNLPDCLIRHCTTVPLTVVPDDYTVQCFSAFLEASAEFYKWACYADEFDYQLRTLERLIECANSPDSTSEVSVITNASVEAK